MNVSNSLICFPWQLLDDGSGRDPLEVYNFGKAANYLFRPCQNDDGSPDEECDIRFMSDLATSSNPIISDEDRKSLDEIRAGFRASKQVNGAATATAEIRVLE